MLPQFGELAASATLPNPLALEETPSSLEGMSSPGAGLVLGGGWGSPSVYASPGAPPPSSSPPSPFHSTGAMPSPTSAPGSLFMPFPSDHQPGPPTERVSRGPPGGGRDSRATGLAGVRPAPLNMSSRAGVDMPSPLVGGGGGGEQSPWGLVPCREEGTPGGGAVFGGVHAGGSPFGQPSLSPNLHGAQGALASPASMTRSHRSGSDSVGLGALGARLGHSMSMGSLSNENAWFPPGTSPVGHLSASPRTAPGSCANAAVGTPSPGSLHHSNSDSQFPNVWERRAPGQRHVPPPQVVTDDDPYMPWPGSSPSGWTLETASPSSLGLGASARVEASSAARAGGQDRNGLPPGHSTPPFLLQGVNMDPVVTSMASSSRTPAPSPIGIAKSQPARLNPIGSPIVSSPTPPFSPLVGGGEPRKVDEAPPSASPTMPPPAPLGASRGGKPSGGSSRSGSHSSRSSGSSAKMSPGGSGSKSPKAGGSKGSEPKPPPEDTDGSVYQVKFKRNQRNFLLSGGNSCRGSVTTGSIVVVEADRGEDLGVVVSKMPLEQFVEESATTAGHKPRGFGSMFQDTKRVLRLATEEEKVKLREKNEEEEQVLRVCRNKVKQRSLPMYVIDAEYQFDRHKLTFFFEAERRIDFRELVRDLFSVYKTRIWLQQIDMNASQRLTLNSPSSSTRGGAESLPSKMEGLSVKKGDSSGDTASSRPRSYSGALTEDLRGHASPRSGKRNQGPSSGGGGGAAAPMSSSSSAPEAFICLLTRKIMRDPCMCADGHTYERSAIEAWLKRHSTSPRTSAELDHKHVTPNISLRSAIQDFLNSGRRGDRK
uniref:U-box domain-containing protein n=1 Tax=Rhizochromulina marina TaxID=1034831 RepID=A0A7S2RAB1_9STRA|mmetsp:Transcript_13420/g.39025  ORF Transcript_13420/g.39025 Transcript_13420/m.39025 type:complete len:823 (+) Transcript_13420:245-2713(+)